jgi:hypothetical protein
VARNWKLPVLLMRPADHRVAGLFGHRQTLAGEHRLVHRTGAVEHDAVDGNLFTRTHDHDVAEDHILDGHLDLFGAGADAAQDTRRLGAQPQQLADGVAVWPLPRASRYLPTVISVRIIAADSK